MQPDNHMAARSAHLSPAVQIPPTRPVSYPLMARTSLRLGIDFLRRQLACLSRRALIALTFVLLAAVGLVDYLTGYEFSMLIFYLLPISLAAWFVGRSFAMTVSLLSVGIGVVADLGAGAAYAHKAVLIWNAAIVLGFFLVVAVLLVRLRESLADLETRVRQRTAALTEEMVERDRLEKEVLEISEREQRRIGHDLHDSLGQHLTATALAGQVLNNHLTEHCLIAHAAEAERIVGLLEESIELTRNLARGLSPVALETEGLTAALAELAENTTAQFYLPCVWHCDPAMRFTDPVAAMHLYRIAQESISNAIRHGRSSRVDIRLVEDPAGGRLTLTVHDDGRGLPSAADQRPGGQGLRIMAHRARMIGATLDIFSADGGGTTVLCALDLSPRREAASLDG